MTTSSMDSVSQSSSLGEKRIWARQTAEALWRTWTEDPALGYCRSYLQRLYEVLAFSGRKFVQAMRSQNLFNANSRNPLREAGLLGKIPREIIDTVVRLLDQAARVSAQALFLDELHAYACSDLRLI